MSSLIEPGKPATPPAADRSSAERERARKRLEKKNKLRGDLVAYVVINLAIIGVWALTGFGYFWPGLGARCLGRPAGTGRLERLLPAVGHRGGHRPGAAETALVQRYSGSRISSVEAPGCGASRG